MKVIALFALLAGGGGADVNTITVHGARDPEELKSQVSSFVGSITRHSATDAFARWHVPVCPLVGGLSKDKAEYFLQRVSDVARAARAPLAPEKCSPNFLIMVTSQPDELLQAWQKKTPHLFTRNSGGTAIRRFVESDLPVRVWYNANADCDGKQTSFDIQSDVLSASCHSSGMLSRLERTAVRNLSSVIVVVDKERIKGLKVGQVADYIAMTGLAEIRRDDDPVAVPTVLNLFASSPTARPAGLSEWDQSFLKSLYRISARNTTQASEIKLQIFRDLVAADPAP